MTAPPVNGALSSRSAATLQIAAKQLRARAECLPPRPAASYRSSAGELTRREASWQIDGEHAAGTWDITHSNLTAVGTGGISSNRKS
jgi:hypothetical protein